MSKTKNNSNNDCRSCCEKVPEDYIKLKDFLSQSDDSNKVTGSFSNKSLFLVEIGIVLFIALIITTLIVSNINIEKNNITPGIIIASVGLLSCLYFIAPIIYTSRYLYLSNIKKHFITSIIIAALHIIVYLVLLYFCFKKFL